jgi:hypothetical protein
MENTNPAQTPQSPMEEKTWRQWIPLGILIVAAALIGWQLGKPTTKDMNDKNKEQTSSVQTTQKEESIQKPSSGSQSIQGDQLKLEGVMLPSKEPKRGNVVLQSGDQIIYLWTSRDIGQFIDKEVTVTGTGSITSFKISSIELKK